MAEARAEAVREAKSAGKAMVFSRGTWLATSDRAGQCSPRVEAECPVWHRTSKEIYELIRLVESRYPDVIEIYLAGGYDAADSRQAHEAGDYDPWASSWTVTVWTKPGGIVPELRWSGEPKS